MSGESALAEVINRRMSWASLHWFRLHRKGGVQTLEISPEIGPAVAQAILASDWLAEQKRKAAEAALAEIVRRWSDGLDAGCPSCGPVDDCDHIEGYHHALSDIRDAITRGECSCGSPSTYSLNPAEVVVHCTDGPCYIAPKAGGAS